MIVSVDIEMSAAVRCQEQSAREARMRMLTFDAASIDSWGCYRTLAENARDRMGNVDVAAASGPAGFNQVRPQLAFDSDWEKILTCKLRIIHSRIIHSRIIHSRIIHSRIIHSRIIHSRIIHAVT
jgi:hypothetical protein